MGKGTFVKEADGIKEEGLGMNEEEMQGLAITTNCGVAARVAERFRWPQSLQLLDSLAKTLPTPGRHRQTTATAASRTNHIRPDMGLHMHGGAERKGAKGVGEGKRKASERREPG